jgi:hypothetical protein
MNRANKQNILTENDNSLAFMAYVVIPNPMVKVATITNK